MKEEALLLAADLPDPAGKLNLLREYMQALTLRSLHESKAFLNLAFVGGTALRFIAAIPRFSEDLDFSLHLADGYRPEAWLKKLKTDLTLAGFDVCVNWNDRTVVHKAWIKTAGILKAAGLAAMPQQNLSIKLEIDTRPPAGAVLERSVITCHRMLVLQHYDMASLMAGKIHALATRNYPKGRDWYDLLWYLGHRPPLKPNLIQLQHALDQTLGASAPDAKAWKPLLLSRLDGLDCRKLITDVAPFLEHPEEAALLNEQNIRAVLL
ncbi:MAG: nucleotidyl transferase AbiEii/AbiGii toxin family protein [bacterium]